MICDENVCCWYYADNYGVRRHFVQCCFIDYENYLANTQRCVIRCFKAATHTSELVGN